MVNHILDIGEKNFGDLAIRADNLDGGFAERLCAAQVVNSTADASAIVGDDLNVVAIEHSLQFFHHREKVIHGFNPFLDR
ncbi:MAG: hypothetical protein ACREBD_18060 [Blastocatellia bacterium]